MSSSTALRASAADVREIAALARPLIEKMMNTTRELNLLFMAAWHDGTIDDVWSEYRKTAPDLYLTYFIRTRGMGDIKIGKTNHMRTRFKSLHSGASRGLDLIACYPSSREHETYLQDEFFALRLSGEWFRPGPELITHLKLIGCDVYGFTNDPPGRFASRSWKN